MAWSPQARAASAAVRKAKAKGKRKSASAEAAAFKRPSRAKVAAARKKARETGYIGTPKRISREFVSKYSTAASIRKKYYGGK